MNKQINSRYFDESEFWCSCCQMQDMNSVLISMLDQARGLADVPFVITSGYRCKRHNAQIGGVPTSAHTFGLAVDIACSSSRLRFRILRALIKAGFHRIGIAKSFIHVDIDGTKDPDVIWQYG
jgi:uncharacterized protein YcbK (DUF882 family)